MAWRPTVVNLGNRQANLNRDPLLLGDSAIFAEPRNRQNRIDPTLQFDAYLPKIPIKPTSIS